MTEGQQALEADIRAGVDVKEALMRRAIADLGPYIKYSDGTVTDRRTGEILWRKGDDPMKEPKNPERGFSDKPHNRGYFGGGGTGPLRRRGEP